MFRMLTTCCLMFIPLYFASAEDSTFSLITEFKADQEQLSEQNGIERIRALVKVHAGLTAKEKKIFLSENGLTKKEFKELKALAELNWKTEGTHVLPLSNSSISIPNDYALLTGDDAVALYTVEGKFVGEFLEAYICDSSSFQNEIVFQNFKTGYISIDDWKGINSKELIDEITQGTEERNEERRKQGSNELHVIGWIQEPTLDQSTNTVFWAIEASDSGNDDNLVNAVAIRLGREGYEQLTWITSRSSYVSSGGPLDTMLSAHSFDQGYRYSDYVTGDKLAEYGIASLVAVTAGGKALKAGGIAFLFKKIAGLVFAGIAALVYKFKNFFRRNKDAS